MPQNSEAKFLRTAWLSEALGLYTTVGGSSSQDCREPAGECACVNAPAPLLATAGKAGTTSSARTPPQQSSHPARATRRVPPLPPPPPTQSHTRDPSKTLRTGSIPRKILKGNKTPQFSSTMVKPQI